MKKMQKKIFRIGELAKKLEIEASVIRFWEKEFSMEAQRSEGQQRFYTEVDLNKFIKIKDLLYKKKFTIAGAKEALKEPKQKVALKNYPAEKHVKVIPSKLEKQILELQDKLIKLRELL